MSECHSCTFYIRAPRGGICGEGLTNENNDCPFYKYLPNNRPLPPKHIKDIIMNPYEYWDRVPRHVRGILPHKSLVMTDIGLCIFSNPSWLVMNKQKDGWLICPSLVNHLRNYIKRVKGVYVYLVISDSESDACCPSSYGPHYHYKRPTYTYTHIRHKYKQTFLLKNEHVCLYILCSSNELSSSCIKWKYNGGLYSSGIWDLDRRDIINIPRAIEPVLNHKCVKAHLLENIKY